MRYLICIGFLIFVGTASITVSAQSPIARKDVASEDNTDNADAKADPYAIPSQSVEPSVDWEMDTASGKPVALTESWVPPPSNGNMELQSIRHAVLARQLFCRPLASSSRSVEDRRFQ
jgi:hypothetical protein